MGQPAVGSERRAEADTQDQPQLLCHTVAASEQATARNRSGAIAFFACRFKRQLWLRRLKPVTVLESNAVDTSDQRRTGSL